MTTKERGHELLAMAGIAVNGSKPTDVQVRNERLWDRVFAEGSIAVGESYMDGWWDAEDLSGMLTKVFTSGIDQSLRSIGTLWYSLRARLINRQSAQHAFEVGERHYDIGNDLYERMLDRRMVYTCGYWSGSPKARALDEAQEAKLDLVCRKLGLKPGDSVLDIGCGWGSFAAFAAEKYGARVTGITISKEQAALAKERCANLSVEIRLEDYRDTTGQFDHIVSLGMFEHVGYKNYATYMQKAHELLKDGGLFLLHTIGWFESGLAADPWIDKYIFPNGVLPSVAQIGKAIERRFIMEDWHNFGADYDKTLMAWYGNFESVWPELKEAYSERFYRMWRFYLLSCAASFRSRQSQLWQIVLSKRGVPHGYASVR